MLSVVNDMPRRSPASMMITINMGVSRRLPACGVRTCGERLVWHSRIQRHFVLVLCFHRHSRFVPSNSSRGLRVES
jgi:hypothetical protein